MVPAKSDRDTAYSMRVVTRLTGLTADAIRKWEERYGAIEPERTAGNRRRYSARQVRRLRALRELTQRGFPIGDVARLADDELERRLAQGESAALRPAAQAAVALDETLFEQLRRDYLDAVRRFDVRRGGELLSRTAAVVGPLELTHRLVLPLLRQVGEGWSRGELGVAHEHLVSAQIRGLLATLQHWTQPPPGHRRVVLATPENHWHEFGVMVAGLLAAGRGFEPIYLGPSLPERDLRQAVDQSHAVLLILGVARRLAPAERAPLVRSLHSLAERVPTWIGMPPDHELRQADTGARCFSSYEDLDMALAEFGLSSGT